jgi:hypothetical protein
MRGAFGSSTPATPDPSDHLGIHTGAAVDFPDFLDDEKVKGTKRKMGRKLYAVCKSRRPLGGNLLFAPL